MWWPAFAAAAWLTVDTGGAHACGIQQDGSLWCWGANESGQLGLGDTTDRSVPTQVGTPLDWASVAAGSSHTCALTTSGLRYCWGSNDSGQLGLNNTTGTTTPARRPGEHLTWLSITSGGATTCGITTSSPSTQVDNRRSSGRLRPARGPDSATAGNRIVHGLPS